MARRGQGLLSVASELDSLPTPDGGGGNFLGAFNGGSGKGDALRAKAEMQSNVSDQLARVSAKIGAMADNAAAKEGAEAGYKAGLDPEFRPGNDWTVYGEAYNKAALETYGARVRIAVEQDIEAGGDLTAKKKAWLGKAELPASLKPDIELQFQRGILVQQRTEARAAAERVAQEAKATIENEISVKTKGLHQRSYQMGLDRQADAIVAGELVEMQTVLNRTGVDGKPLVDPVAAARILRGARQEVANARILGAFDRMQGGPPAKQKFIDSLEQDFSSSSGIASEYDLDGFRALQNTLKAQLAREITEGEASVRSVLKQVQSLEDRVDKGYAPPPDEIAATAAATAATGNSDAAAAMAKVDAYMKRAAWMRTLPPDSLRAIVEDEDRALKAGGATADQVKYQGRAKTLLDEAEAAIKSDPHEWAERTGQLAVVPLDLSTPQAAAESFTRRVAASETLSQKWNRKVSILRPNEVTAVTAALGQGGEQGLRTMAMISAAAGEENRLKVFEEISKEAPSMAWLGALAATTGNPDTPGSITRDVMDGVALRKIDGYKPRGPKSAEETRIAARSVLGDVFQNAPANETAVIELANAAYEARSAGKQSFDQALWQRGLKEALGETVYEGKNYGGVVATRDNWGADDRNIHLPVYVRQDSWREVFDMISPGDLDRAGIARPVDSSGAPMRWSRVRAGLIEQTGTSRFTFELADNPTGEPLTVGAQGGGEFEIDLDRLRPILAKRRPDLFLPGGR